MKTIEHDRTGVWNRIFYALCIASLLVGVRILILPSMHTSKPIYKLLAFSLICIPLTVLYLAYRSANVKSILITQVDLKFVCFGLLLILLDISYNIHTSGALGHIDYTVLSIGTIIILLNTRLSKLLKLDTEMVSFSSYFLFIFLILYLFFFKLPMMVSSSETINPFLAPITKVSLTISATLLNFIRPTFVDGIHINFDGFAVEIGDACSGVVSMTVFLSAAVAYFIAVKEKNFKRICVYSIVGISILFFLNILRIMTIVMVGYHFGSETMLFVHENLGWVLFVLAMAVFWYLIIRESESDSAKK